ncbi:Gfo/Idh/MocA family oxidoreductase [Candidatus Haliotispira prima]|uniref:Gfo/Idh/MocA family oxidoreductase n=1 Tax=Candidatus Haliotispira prima TaxID=3034016 RepID=A0ABY8MK57_9SPIO|nr:Gfo/Idh/MocA family oxidoreductase [Candidatus Haliotispira prima]
MIKTGIIGAGMISPSGIEGFQKSGIAEVLAIADKDEAHAQERAQEYGIPRVYGSAEELLADKDIEVVYVALPNKFHVPVSLAALEVGKHVICEKPMAMDLAEGRKLVEALQKYRSNGRDLKFMIGQNQRFNADSQKIKYLAEQGYFGELYHAKAFWRRRCGVPKKGTWFGSRELAGGGCILDIGVHMLDLALFIMNNFDAESVSGASYSKLAHRGIGFGGWGMGEDRNIPFDVDDLSCALIKLKGGATVALDVSWASHSEHDDFHNVDFYGSEAGAQCYPAKVFTFDKLLCSNVDVELKSGDTAESAFAGLPIRYPDCDRFAHFVRAVRNEEELCVKLEESLEVQRILDAIRESARTGREVRLDT